MYIDLHCHTKKCKTGDASTREASKEIFIKQVNKANVGAVAITNHNVFDLEQYNNFLNNDFMVWPGIELDVNGENGSYGHCILIVSPNEATKFSESILKLTKTSTPDTFRISLKELSNLAKEYHSIVTCHYGKSPNLSDESIKILKRELGDIPMFLEPSKLISAGIYLAHNIDSLLGSDVQDWNKYENYSFPELKMEIDSYDRFLLLIKKDKEIIKTFIDKKKKDSFKIAPFENAPNEKISIQLYNDTNVIIGGKGTGKTKILEAIEAHYNSIQSDCVSTYYGAKNSMTYEKIIKMELDNDDYNKLPCNAYEKEFNEISQWKMPSPEKTSNYYKWICNKKEIKNFWFSNTSFYENPSSNKYENEFNLFKENKKNLLNVLNTNLTNYLSEQDAQSFKELSLKLIECQRKKVINEYCNYQAMNLLKFTIDKMKDLYLIKKGKSSKPNNCGLFSIYQKCYELQNKAKNIINTLDTYEKNIYHLIGKIPNKGYLYVRKNLTLNPNLPKYDLNSKVTVRDLKEIYKSIKEIYNNVFSLKIPSHVSKFNDLIKNNSVNSIKKFLRGKTDVILSNENNPKLINKIHIYEPSTGERSMLILNNSLYRNKDIFILDEPELSVGHDYINNMIVPRIIELSKLNKTVIISTHDANIAVRTLPFTTIYRCGDQEMKTYIGNPFNEEMINIEDPNDKLSWAKTCIDTLEGGEIAFRERGDSYGRKNL